MKAPTYRARGVLGNVRGMTNDPLGFLQDAANACGPVARFRLGPYVAHLISGPEQVHRALVDTERNYDRNTRQFAAIGMGLGKSLLTTSGDSWRARRRMVQPAFHRERIAGLGAQMAETIETTLASWRPGHTDLTKTFADLTYAVILRTMFGATDLPRAEFATALEHMVGYVDRAMTAPVSFPLWVPTPANTRFLAARSTVDATALRLIQRGLARPRGGADLLSLLIDAHEGERLGAEELLDEVKGLMLAGHETAANCLAWTFHLLSRHPEWMQQLRAEVQRVVGDRRVTLADCMQLPVVTRVLQESLRLYPPGWLIGRNAAQTHELAGFTIPRGSMIFVSPYVTQRLPSLFPDPTRFDPDRFTPAASCDRHPYAHFPFGGGPHVCIGRSFAMLELQMILVSIVQRFAIDVTSGPATPHPRITLGLREPLRGEIVARQPAGAGVRIAALRSRVLS